MIPKKVAENLKRIESLNQEIKGLSREQLFFNQHVFQSLEIYINLLAILEKCGIFKGNIYSLANGIDYFAAGFFVDKDRDDVQ